MSVDTFVDVGTPQPAYSLKSTVDATYTPSDVLTAMRDENAITAPLAVRPSAAPTPSTSSATFPSSNNKKKSSPDWMLGFYIGTGVLVFLVIIAVGCKLRNGAGRKKRAENYVEDNGLYNNRQPYKSPVRSMMASPGYVSSPRPVRMLKPLQDPVKFNGISNTLGNMDGPGPAVGGPLVRTIYLPQCDRLGLFLPMNNPGQHYVAKVMPGSVAEQNGVQEGNVILTINGHDVRDMSCQSLLELMKNSHTEAAMEMEVAESGNQMPMQMGTGPSPPAWMSPKPLSSTKKEDDGPQKMMDMQTQHPQRSPQGNKTMENSMVMNSPLSGPSRPRSLTSPQFDV